MKQRKLKRRHAIILVVFILLMAVAVISVISDTDSDNGYRTISVVEISGNVSVVKDGIEYTAYEGMMLQEGYEIVTGGGSYVRVVLDDDKYVKLESGSKAGFDKLGFSSSGKTRIKLERGSITSEIVRPLNKEEEFVVSTPNAVLSVRGTFFRVELNPDKNGDLKADVMTYGGKVASQRIKPSGEIVEEEVLIDAGYKASINMTEEDTHYVVEDEKGDLVIVEPVAPDTPEDGGNQGEVIMHPTQPISIEEIPDEDLIDMYFAVDNGHEMFISAEEAKTNIEERDIDLEDKKSVYVITAEVKQKFKDVVANDNKPIVKEEETTESDDKMNGSKPVLDDRGHDCKAVLAGLEQSHSKCRICDKVMSTEHTFVEEVRVSPTCIKMGEMLYVCECGYRYTADIPAVSHTETAGGTLEGHKVCGTCNKILDSIHTFTEEVVVEPGCTTLGELKHTCECGYAYSTDISAIGHTEVAGGTLEGHKVCATCNQVIDSIHIFTDEIMIEPGCTTAGEVKHTCECGYVYISEISAIGHNEMLGGTKDGHKICGSCNEVIDSVHKYLDKVTLEATCDTDGTTTHTCECGYEYATVILATKHTEVYVGTESVHSKCNSCKNVISTTHTYASKVTKEPTCTEKGITTHTCECGYSYTTEIVENGHTEVYGGTENVHSQCSVCSEVMNSTHTSTSKVTKEPTCTEKGVTTHTCECCYSYTTEIAENGHTEVYGGTENSHIKCSVCNEGLSSTHTYTSEVTKEPTCTEKGITTHTCKCGYSYTTEIAEDGHITVMGGTEEVHYICDVCSDVLSRDHNYTSTVITEPTCIMEGVEKHRCECGYVYTEAIDPNGHTETAGGVQECHSKCIICGETLSDEHTLTENVETAATCKTDGVMRHTCDCGYEYTSTIAQTGHTKSEDMNVTTCVDCGEELVMLNAISFPDSALLTYLTGDSIDTYGDDMLDGDELALITELLVPEQVENLMGVELLASLTQLDFSNNTTCDSILIDGSESTSISITGDKDFTSIEIINSSTITNIDLSGTGRVTSTDFWGMTGVVSIIADGSGIELLDISGCTNIEQLSVSSNSSLTEICAEGCSKLSSLNISGTTALTTLDLDDCTALTSLDTSSSTNLQILSANNATNLSNFCGVEGTLDFSFNTNLIEIQLSNNLNFNDINLLSSTYLQKFVYEAMPMSTIDLSGCSALVEISIEGSAVTELDLTACQALDTININECTLLEMLNISGCTNMTFLDLSDCTGLGNLTDLDVSNNANLTSLNVSTLTGLDSMNISNIGNLESIDISNTQLADIDLSLVPNLQTFTCRNALKLGTIDLASVPNLNTLDAAGATLLKDTLDLTYSTNLAILDISGLSFDTLDVIAPCKDTLAILKVNDTNITTISPNEYTTLFRLECRNTQITAFSANDSTLEYVDISGNTLLTQVNVERTTTVKTVIMDDCPALGIAYMFGNEVLETISAKNNSAMTQIQPQGNPYLELMDLTNAIMLQDGKVLENSGTSSGSLTVIVTGTTLTEGSFPNWDDSYMTLVNEG